MSKLLIFNYHKIYTDSKDFSDNGNPFWVSIEDFKNQLDFLIERRINVVSISDWKKGKTKGELSVALTFDDGYDSDLDHVKEELLERNLAASFYPICSLLKSVGYLSQDDLIELHESGFEIGSHSISHPKAETIDAKQWVLELSNSKSFLEDLLDSEVVTFAWPYGYLPKDYETLLKDSGYQNGLTTKKKLNNNPKSILLHRWNIKDTTSLKGFERIIFQKFPTFHLKSLLSRLKV
jgi:peptidoglycan/xylan/chitin deacetylase (PgdA/CDA1 family)